MGGFVVARVMPGRRAVRGAEAAKTAFQVMPILKGTGAAILLSVVLFGVVSILFAYTALPEHYMSLVATLAGVSSVLWGGGYAARKSGRSALLYGSLVGLMYSVLVLAFGAMVLAEPVAREVLWRVGGAVVCGGVGGLLAPKARESLRHRR